MAVNKVLAISQNVAVRLGAARRPEKLYEGVGETGIFVIATVYPIPES